MTRFTLYLLALLMAGCASAHGGAPAVQQAGTAPVESAGEGLVIQPEGDAPLADAPARAVPEPRAKSSTSGATLAEEWSPALGDTLRRYSADPTIRHEVELAQAYREAGILDQAYDHYDAATRRDPREAAAWDGLARIWRDWGYPHLGLGDAHRAAWADPGSPVVHNTLGTILQLLGKHKEARREFALAVAIDPRAAYAHYNLAVACVAQHDYGAAVTAFERAAALDPSLDVARMRADEARQQARNAAAGKGVSHERR